MTVDIRRAESVDCEQLTAIAHAAKRYWKYPEEYIALWRNDLTVTTELVRNEFVYVATEAGTPLGFYALTGTPPKLELDHLWVTPARIRHGVGKTLFTHALATARGLAASEIEVVSDPNARGFYERMGARQVGSEPSVPAGRMLPVLRIALRP